MENKRTWRRKWNSNQAIIACTTTFFQYRAKENKMHRVTFFSFLYFYELVRSLTNHIQSVSCKPIENLCGRKNFHFSPMVHVWQLKATTGVIFSLLLESAKPTMKIGYEEECSYKSVVLGLSVGPAAAVSK